MHESMKLFGYQFYFKTYSYKQLHYEIFGKKFITRKGESMTYSRDRICMTEI